MDRVERPVLSFSHLVGDPAEGACQAAHRQATGIFFGQLHLSRSSLCNGGVERGTVPPRYIQQRYVASPGTSFTRAQPCESEHSAGDTLHYMPISSLILSTAFEHPARSPLASNARARASAALSLASALASARFTEPGVGCLSS